MYLCHLDRSLLRPFRLGLLVAVLALGTTLLSRGDDDSFPKPINTESDDETVLSTPAEALAAIKVPEGFRVTLFAAEPQIRQPIAITTDPRGRLWVAENYTYAENPVVLDERHRDRIVILEDRDNNGEADKRTVFWDQARQLTSIEVGMGGVWAMCPPQLLFLPDADGDDRPDSDPVVVLDGFELGASSHHNFANGLKWGPDGWLYGRNGISNDGHVGLPGTPDQERLLIGPGIWRFHPQTRRLEMVCSGTTNTWGHDWDDHGELFFINTVIGHLWHALPGAHFKRMFGPDHNPYVYELLDQNADHLHWDTAEAWNEAKKGMSNSTDAAGGGHAHCGMMIYLGDNWPGQYRGRLFTLNMHGRRINQDRLERHGATYTGLHEADMLMSSDPWFRGIELLYGPDGGVYIDRKSTRLNSSH
jgi:putative membrane-bound dehydrogenase-like protein